MSDVVRERQDQLARARHFITPTHLTEPALAHVRRWYEASPSRPLQLQDFLLPGFAGKAASMLRDLPVWTRVCRVYVGPDQARYVSEEEWQASDRKWARSWIGTPIDRALDEGVMPAAHRKTLEQFLAFSVLDGPLTTWLRTATGTALDRRGSIELAAYGKGDRIGEHQDRIERRAFAVNFYLDPDYTKGTGGRLGYRNEAGQTFHVEPDFNSVSIIPIQEQSVHWVEEFTEDRRGRLTISVGQNRAAEDSR
jgi:hypothetical protein